MFDMRQASLKTISEAMENLMTGRNMTQACIIKTEHLKKPLKALQDSSEKYETNIYCEKVKQASSV